MRLPETSHNIKKTLGFTLIELLLVIALMTTIGIFASAIGISFYQSQLLHETSDGLVSTLRQAQNYAISGRHDSAFGVALQEDAYILFEGDSYNTRVVSEDMIFHMASTISVSGPNEIVFSLIQGAPSNTGIFSISLGTKETHFEIMASGNIDR
ncbi:MAG: hypothetical protein WAW13_01490 [Minisyncoccia bacterium]